ncbi:hypothetical protein [Salarchaeum japonicum]|uniref:Envelope protein N-terminal domain-containing protein n=1 Tax=Salarchaeum japonicum TaxID=555573 RepID=A0AAV3T003_9EURY|nr:hypothetical protein [Salarchaeum japonicum]
MTNRFASLLAALVVVSTVLGGVGFAATPAAASSDDVTVCNSEENMLGWLSGFFRGYGGTNAYSQEDGVTHANPNPCYMQGNTIDGDTETEAARRLASLALEDKAFTMQYFDQWDNYAQRLQNPAIGDGRTAFIESVTNGSEEISAVTDAHTAAHERVAKQQLHLWRQYLSQTNALAGLVYQAQDAGVADNIRIGYINDNGTYKTGYKVSRVTSPDFAANKSTATTVVTASGEQVVVPTLWKYNDSSDSLESGGAIDTVNPLTQDVLVQVWNPETGSWVDLINTATFTQSLGPTYDGTGLPRSIDLTKAKKVKVDLSLGNLPVDGESDTMLQIGDVTVETRQGQYSYWTDINGPNTPSPQKSGSGVTVTVTYNEGEVTISNSNGPVHTFTPSDRTLELTDGDHTNMNNIRVYNVTTRESYTNQFRARHDELESVDNAVIEVLGDSNGGLLSQLYEKLQSGNVSAQDYHTTSWYIQHSMETSDRGDQSWRAMLLSSLGYSLTDVSKTVEVDVLAGSVVDGQQINSTNTYSGWIATDSTPPNGTWTNDMTYSVGDGADLTKPVHIIYTDETGEWVNGTYETDVTSRTAVVSSGDITVQSITNADGEEVENATQHANDPNESNLTKVLEQVKANQEQYKELVEMMDEDNDGDESDATGGGGNGPNFDPSGWFDWVPTPGDVVPDLPYGLIGIGIAGFGIVLLVGPILGPFLIALWSRL